jgi:hypothetical protein
MQQLLKDYPKLRTFSQHGVKLYDIVGDGQALGDCPFCGKVKHFYAHPETRQWDCKSCGRQGGTIVFLEEINQINKDNLQGDVLTKIAKHRGLKPRTLREWGVGWAGGELYTVPIVGESRLIDLRLYQLGKKARCTNGCKIGVIGGERLLHSRNEEVWICEGEWDALALHEIFEATKRKSSVVGIPSANTFKDDWVELFAKKDIVIAYDHDDAGERGSVRVMLALKGLAKSIRFIRWPEESPKGYDIRNLYNDFELNAQDTLDALHHLLTADPPKTAETVEQRVYKPIGDGLDPAEVLEGYKKWLYVPDPEIIDVVFGVMFANRLEGDPLWVFLTAPPGGMKSELLMSLSEAPLTMMLTSLTEQTLVSGSAGGPYGADPSLIPKLHEHVLLIKDFTTILQMNPSARDNILGQLRDAYDRKTGKHFGTGLQRDYDSRFGLFAGVTGAIDGVMAVNSTLGERFVKYRLPFEEGILKGDPLIQRAIQNVALEGEMRKELADVATKALDREVSLEDKPEISTEMQRKFMLLAQWVAGLRGTVVRDKWSQEIQFKPVTEIGTRLAKQLVKVSVGVSIYRRKEVMDEDEFEVAVKVGRHTIPDLIDEIIKAVYINCHCLGDSGCSEAQLQKWSRLNSETVKRLCEDLTMLRVLERNVQGRFKLNPTVYRLTKEVGIYKQEEMKCQMQKPLPPKRKLPPPRKRLLPPKRLTAQPFKEERTDLE